MTSRSRPARAKLNLPMPPWFDSTCRALKAHMGCLAKFRQSTCTLKEEYKRKSICRRKCHPHKKTIANKVTNLIEARDVQVFVLGQRHMHNMWPCLKASGVCAANPAAPWLFSVCANNGQTPIPAHVWTNYLKERFAKSGKCSKRSGP